MSALSSLQTTLANGTPMVMFKGAKRIAAYPFWITMTTRHLGPRHGPDRSAHL